MYLKFYRPISDYLRNKSRAIIWINGCNKLLTGLGFIAYPLLLLILYWRKEKKLTGYILVPAFSFCFVTLFRKMMNRKRPYETHDFSPLIPRDKKGHSFPSRHIFSMTIIAGCWFFFCPPIGAILFICSLLLAIIRIVSGVHYPSDVIAGGIIGLISSYIAVIVEKIF